MYFVLRISYRPAAEVYTWQCTITQYAPRNTSSESNTHFSKDAVYHVEHHFPH